MIQVTYDEWWSVMMTKRYDGIPGHFIHPVCEASVLAGNANIRINIMT